MSETESILVLAEHPHIGDLWVKLNADALQDPDKDVYVVVQRSNERMTASNRLIIIGRHKRSVIDHARGGCTGQVIHLQHTDRLAAGWRTA